MKLKKAVEILQNLDLSKDYSEVIISIFKNSWALPAFGVNFQPGEEFIRARPMEIYESRFTKKDDFSFKPEKYNRSYQRASTPNRTMFYAASNRDKVSSKDLFSARLVSLGESMGWVRNKNESGIRKIAYGKWISNETLNLITIVNQNIYHGVNPFVKALFDDFLNEIQKIPERGTERIPVFSRLYGNSIF